MSHGVDLTKAEQVIVIAVTTEDLNQREGANRVRRPKTTVSNCLSEYIVVYSSGANRVTTDSIILSSRSLKVKQPSTLIVFKSVDKKFARN